jgi:hypothetical protein
MCYSVDEYFKIMQYVQVYKSDFLTDFVTGQIKIFKILCSFFLCAVESGSLLHLVLALNCPHLVHIFVHICCTYIYICVCV